ncbi:HIT family protein [Acidiplasma sp.]|uniref:HIT family protein n=1 Tax=Acidiplasma sp. TaxID=1872114 RepID=UPI0025906D0C|nr:HIT family protein [Acidiplasma sp.]
MCIFCDIVSNRARSYKVYEDDNTLAFLDIYPISRGHILVIPKRHYENIFEMDNETLLNVFRTVKIVTDLIKRKWGINNVNIMNSNGKLANQTVFHYHVHIIPRIENDNLNFVDEWWVKKIMDVNDEYLERIKRELTE